MLSSLRVILRAPYVADSIINRSQYKQMIGRAGRAGIDTSGESILVLKETDKAKVSLHVYNNRARSLFLVVRIFSYIIIIYSHFKSHDF